MTWYVLTVNSQRERWVGRALADKKVLAYVPLHVTWARHARRTKTRTRALIPGYVFADLVTDHDIAVALDLRPVREIMSQNEKPRELPPGALAGLFLVEACHWFDETWQAPPIKGPRYSHRWKKGDQVRVNKGPFAGFVGTVLKAQGRARMQVVLSMFARSLEISVPHSDLDSPPIDRRAA